MGFSVVTGRTFFRGLFACMRIPAVPASPCYLFITFKDSSGLQIGQQIAETLFMLFFRYGNGLEYGCNFIKTFFTGCCGKLRVHDCMLMVLTANRFLQIFLGGTNHSGRKSGGNFNFTTLKQFK